MKYGITIPRDYDEAVRLDRENGNDYWLKAINKEINVVRIAFDVIADGDPPPVGSKQISYHCVFDVKMDLTRKARVVAGGHMANDVPSYLSYSSVVSRETVRLSFMVASLNNLEILAADVGNAYLNATPKEKSVSS